MLARTHIALGFCLSLIFIKFFDNDILFVMLVLFSSLLPDIDSTKSLLGKRWYLRPVQWCVKHRGIFHSFSFLIFISIIISFVFPSIVFPIFLGYSLHLIADSITVEGIRPFWPFSAKIAGNIKTGGRVEDIVFIFVLVISLILLILLLF